MPPGSHGAPVLTGTAQRSELLVHVVPNAARTGCAGLHDGALRIRVAAPAIDGRANALLLGWLARSLGLPKRAVRLASGESARRKRVEMDCPAEAVSAWLAAQQCDAGDR